MTVAMHAPSPMADERTRRHLVVFDLAVAADSPAGSCVRAEVLGLAPEFDITVLSNRCDVHDHANVRWLRVPLPERPLVLRYAAFRLLAPLVLRWHRRRGLPAPDWVQGSQGQYERADIAYAHFCHRAYLAGPWRASPVRGLRRGLRWLNHRFNAFCDARTFRRARLIVVPSQGLARELVATYPHTAGRVALLPNPVDLAHYGRPDGPDRAELRQRLNLPLDATLFCFVALGDFDRKGLDLLLPALASLGAKAHLVVVGGRPGEIASWVARAGEFGVASQVHFVGLQADVRPYLWASDAYAFPSAYEIFSLAILQAAAAGLPVIVSRGLYGAEEFVIDGENGWLVERSAEAIAAALREACADPARRAAMGARARGAVQRYSREAFVQRWRELFVRLRATEDR